MHERRSEGSGARRRSWGRVVRRIVTGIACLGVPAGSVTTPSAVNPAALVAERPDPAHAEILRLVREHRGPSDEASQRRIARAIHEEALAASVDPLFVAAIVARESSFRHAVTSHAGAVGLMQLRPFVAESVAARADVDWNGADTLREPRLNVRLGIHYYKELVRRFDGDERIALAAYHRGPTRVRLQLRRGTFEGSRYADRVLETYDRARRRAA